MKKAITIVTLTLTLITSLGGCDLQGTTVYRGYVVEPTHYAPSSTSVVIAQPVPVTCPAYLEDHYAPYYHAPTWCTDYGPAGRCCTWTYFDGYGECSDEWCFWEDTCDWEPILEECVYETYEYYYPY